MNQNVSLNPEHCAELVNKLSSGKIKRAQVRYYRQPGNPSDKWNLRVYPMIKYESTKAMIERENLESQSRMIANARTRKLKASWDAVKRGGYGT